MEHAKELEELNKKSLEKTDEYLKTKENLGEEHHDLAAGTLPGIAVLQSPGVVAEHRLAPRALDLDEAHGPATMTIGNRLPAEREYLKKA